MPPIPLSEPNFTGNEWRYVKECIDTGWVSTAGPFVERFESELAAKTGAFQAVATQSGTAALHVALIVAGVHSGDEVIMPALSFVAPANAVRYCGAWPTFIDVSADDWQIDLLQLAQFLEDGCERRDGRLYNKKTGRPTAAILPVHLLGGMFDVDAMASLAAKYDLPVVEDAAECLGATYRGRGMGRGTSAKPPLRLVATSFNGNKIVTTGGGGAILGNNPDALDRCRHLVSTAKLPGLGYVHDEVGYNYRMTNIAAALGVAQLESLDAYVSLKRQAAARYEAAFEGEGRITLHPEPRHCNSTYWMYTVLLDRPSRPIIERLNDEGIQSRPLWHPLSRLPALAADSHVVADKIAADLYERALSLPLSTTITDAQIDQVSAALLGILDADEMPHTKPRQAIFRKS